MFNSINSSDLVTMTWQILYRKWRVRRSLIPAEWQQYKVTAIFTVLDCKWRNAPFLIWKSTDNFSSYAATQFRLLIHYPGKNICKLICFFCVPTAPQCNTTDLKVSHVTMEVGWYDHKGLMKFKWVFIIQIIKEKTSMLWKMGESMLTLSFSF